VAWHEVNGHVTFYKASLGRRSFWFGRGSWRGMCGAGRSVAFNIYGRKEILTSCLFSVGIP